MSFTISTIRSRPYTPGFENGFTVPLLQNPVPSPQMGLGVPLSLIPFSVSHPSFRSHGGEWRVRLQNFRPGLPALAAGVGLMMGVLTPTEAMAQQNANSPEANSEISGLGCVVIGFIAMLNLFLLVSAIVMGIREALYLNKPPKP